MNIELLSQEYQVKKMEETDVPEVYALCMGNPMYYSYCPPGATIDGIKNDMRMLPPGKKAEDKFYIGFYQEKTLIAVMDLIDGYPNQKTVFIGFFMMNQAVQGKGIGSNIITESCRYFKKAGFLKVGLGYAKGNLQSERFWLKNQFIKTGSETQADGYVIVRMERQL